MTPDLYNLAMELIPPDPTPPTQNIQFDLWVDPPHVTFSHPGDVTKRGYVYVTAGGSGATILADQYTIAATVPNTVNVTCNADSSAGDGTGISRGSSIMNQGVYPGTVHLAFTFTAGVPQTFNVYCIYYATGGTQYTDGNTQPFPSVVGSGVPTPIPHVTFSYSPASPSSGGTGSTLALGGVTMTYNP